MKKYIILFFLFSAGASYAQPVIDSMLIDEMKGELYIYGTFGATQGKVTVDSVDIQLKTWSDSLIVGIIPATGRGYAGPVVVESNGLQNPGRWITSWKVAVRHLWCADPNCSSGVDERIDIVMRLDIQSRLSKGDSSNQISFFSSIVSDSGSAHWIRAFPQQPSMHNGFVTPIILDLKNKLFTFTNCYSLAGILIMNADSYFEIEPSSMSVTPGKDSMYWYSEGTSFPPPHYSKPQLSLPKSETLFSYLNNINLVWYQLSLMTSYHLQVSSDSLFILRKIDSTIAPTTFALPPLVGLTKYFWRVAGVNSEGESRWSDVWNFTTGATASVAGTPSSSFTFSAYPNPASDKLNISYSASQGEVAIALYDLLGNKVRSLIQKADGARTAELALRGLPTGMYVLELQSGSLHNSMPISILR